MAEGGAVVSPRLHWRRHSPGDHLMQTVHLTPTEDGYLLRLRDLQWVHGAIPVDEAKVFAMVRAPDEDQKTVRKLLKEFFDRTSSGFIDRSIQEERKHAEAIVADRSNAGAAGARARWSKSTGSKSSNGKRMANAKGLLKQTDGDHSTSHQVKVEDYVVEGGTSLASGNTHAREGLTPGDVQ